METLCPVLIRHWWDWHPQVGAFIAILGFIGIVLPLFFKWDSHGRWWRAIWTLVMIALLLLELRTLHLDRIEHDADQKHAECEQLHRFQDIADKLRDNLHESQQQFRRTMNAFDIEQTGRNHQFAVTMDRTQRLLIKTKNVTDLAQNSLRNLTGGDSYAYLVPANFVHERLFTLAIRNTGKWPLTGVVVKIQRIVNDCVRKDEHGDCLAETDQGFLRPIQIGTLPGEDETVIPTKIDADPDGIGSSHYKILISAQNGKGTEQLRFRLSTDKSGYEFFAKIAAPYTLRRGEVWKQPGTPVQVVKIIDWQQPKSWSGSTNPYGPK